MRITNATGPMPAPSSIVNPINPETKARAVAMLTGQPVPGAQPEQQMPVPNPNAVSAEDTHKNDLAIPEQAQVEAKTPTDMPVEKKETDPQLSQQFAKLARREKQLRIQAQQQEQALKQREAALAAKEAELNGRPSFDQSKYIAKDELSANTIRELEKLGISYDALTQQYINAGTVDPRTEAMIQRQEERIKQLESRLEDASKNAQKQQEESYNAALRQIEQDVRKLVKSDPNFETVRATGSTKDVVDLIRQTYDKDGILLDVQEATQMVEDYLVEEAFKLTQIGKIKSKLEKAVQPAPARSQAQPQQQPQIKTLTNAVSSTRQLSRRERAILAARGELKQ